MICTQKSLLRPILHGLQACKLWKKSINGTQTGMSYAIVILFKRKGKHSLSKVTHIRFLTTENLLLKSY